jgi:hypothetical protein
MVHLPWLHPANSDFAQTTKWISEVQRSSLTMLRQYGYSLFVTLQRGLGKACCAGKARWRLKLKLNMKLTPLARKICHSWFLSIACGS